MFVRSSPANAGATGDAGSMPELGSSPGVGNGNSLQYSCLGNSMDMMTIVNNMVLYTGADSRS